MRSLFKHIHLAILCVMLVFCASNAAQAQTYFSTTTGTLGSQNSSKDYAVTATNDGTSNVVRFASDTGITYPYVNYTSANTADTLIAGQSGVTITDMGGAVGPTAAGYCSKHTLPRAAAGLQFSFSAGSKCFMTVDTVDASDTILYSISGTGLDAGDSIKSTGQAGDSVTLFSTAANQWQIKAMKATWTDNSTN